MIEFLVTPWRPGPGPKGIETTIHWHFVQNGHTIYRSLTFYSATPHRVMFHTLDSRTQGTTERRIIEHSRVARIKITYQVPSQGRFLPDFISMARKMTNVMDMIRSSNWRHGLGGEVRGASMEIYFETLGSNVDGERRPFWEVLC
jgi:IS1 family transposase